MQWIVPKLALGGLLLLGASPLARPETDDFSGKRALELIETQVGFGTRALGSPGHEQIRKWLGDKLRESGATVEVQDFTYQVPKGEVLSLANVIGRFAPEKKRRLLLGTHFDTKRWADMDVMPQKHKSPVPGANDVASGVAVLLELGRLVSSGLASFDYGIDLVFFDGEEGAEDFGDPEWRMLGSEYFSAHLDSLYQHEKPFFAIVLEMVCDHELKIFQDKISLHFAQKFLVQIYDIAAELGGSEQFPREYVEYTMIDDHVSLRRQGVPAVLLLDKDYRAWHTTHDLPDKCSDESLGLVGKVVWRFLLAQQGNTN